MIASECSTLRLCFCHVSNLHAQLFIHLLVLLLLFLSLSHCSSWALLGPGKQRVELVLVLVGGGAVGVAAVPKLWLTSGCLYFSAKWRNSTIKGQKNSPKSLPPSAISKITIGYNNNVACVYIIAVLCMVTTY